MRGSFISISFRLNSITLHQARIAWLPEQYRYATSFAARFLHAANSSFLEALWKDLLLNYYHVLNVCSRLLGNRPYKTDAEGACSTIRATRW